jgi:pilus assembly protein TadC
MLLLAGAILIGVGPGLVRRRAGAVVRARTEGRETRSTADTFAAASTLDLLSVCLSAGMTVPAAASATALFAPPALAAMLHRAADLLALGADPETAWQTDDVDGSCAALARLARRSAVSGSALACGAAELAEQERQGVIQRAAAAAERAGVLIAGPLGLCFLPAFVCLGIVPVVAGLAGELFGAGFL